MSLSPKGRWWRGIVMALYIGMMLVLAVATVTEKINGTDYAMAHIYHARWFVAWWALLVAATVGIMARCRRRLTPGIVVLHGALIVILVGAFTTFRSARRGLVHLPVHTPVGEYLSEATGRYHRLPFTLELDSFRIDYAADGMSPQDYVSYLRVDGRPQRVSMNHILAVRGVRLYQSSYDDDIEGSWLSLNCDPWGIPLTYVGYALLALGFGLTAIERRRKRRHNAHKVPTAPSAAHTAAPATARRGRWIAIALLVLMVGRFLLRWHTAGYVPMSNGYETLQLLALCLLAVGVALARRYPQGLWGTIAVALVAVVVAQTSADGGAISPLAPVLRSPLLVVHVLLVVMAYALLAIMWVNGLVALAWRRPTVVQRLAALTQRLLLPAVVLLAAGIFVGAIWANLSWGRYWGWDPKEVWALITLMLYALPLHGALLPALRRPQRLHTFMALAFLAVLATYFGVNFLLGGMHSYAN